jgi:hypothetical protein
MGTQYTLDILLPFPYPGRDLDRYPIMIYSEIVDSWATRTIEIWPDGHTGISRERDMVELGGAGVPDQPVLENYVPEPDSGHAMFSISQEQFERYWRKAIDRVQHELGVVVSE